MGDLPKYDSWWTVFGSYIVNIIYEYEIMFISLYEWEFIDLWDYNLILQSLKTHNRQLLRIRTIGFALIKFKLRGSASTLKMFNETFSITNVDIFL